MMKKLFLFVIGFVMFKMGYSQYPIQQFIGADSAVVTSKGGLQGRLINQVFADTAAANSQRIRQYPGAMIYAGGKMWVRNTTATGWVELAYGPITVNNIYNSDGTLTGNRELDGNSNNLTFTAVRKFSLSGDSLDYLLDPSGNLRIGLGNQQFIMRGDTASLSRRLSYTGNLGSSFTKHSLIDKNYVDSVASLAAGTVTSVATNNGTGITGGTITSTGTLAIDTLLISTRAWRQKGIDSVTSLINARPSGSGTTNYLSKWTGSTALGNSLVFDNGTNVGIGTASPGSLGSNVTTLSINGLSSVFTGGIWLRSSDNGVRSYIYGTSNLFIIGSETSQPMTFQTAATERMRIFANGNVGIGTNTDAGYRLDVSGTFRSTGDAYFATSSGNVGIGTTSPARNLHIAGSGAIIGTRVTNSLNTGASEYAAINQANIPISIGVTGPNYTPSGAISGNQGYVYVAGALTLMMDSPSAGILKIATGGNTERVRIDASGNVGIGTTSPSNLLVVRKDQNAGTYAQIVNKTDGTASAAALIFESSNIQSSIGKLASAFTTSKILVGNDYYLFNGGSGDISILNDFSTGRIKFAAGGSSTSQMTLFSNGNLGVGVGTTDAGYKLDVNGTARVQNNSGLSLLVGSNSSFTATATPVVLSLGGTYGTTTAGNSSNLKLRIYDAGDANSYFGLGASSNLFELQSSVDFAFFTGASTSRTERLRITQAGSVGIGSTSISSATNQRVVEVLAQEYPTLRLKTVAGSVNAEITANGGNGTFSIATTTTHPMLFWTNNAERMRIFASTGNVAIGYGGSPTDAGYRLDVSGTFRSTGNANVEGSVIFGASGTGQGTLAKSGTEAQFTSVGAIFIRSGASQKVVLASGGGGYRMHLTTTGQWLFGGGSGETLSGIDNNSGQGVLRLLYSTAANSQTEGARLFTSGNFGIGTTTDETSAILNVSSTTKGFLPPRMTNAQMLAIATPASGLMVYDTTNNKLNYYNGTTWVAL